MYITEEHVKKFKSKMNIYHSRKDSEIKDILESSYLFIKDKCGDFSMDEYSLGVDLVYNRARYSYNEALEFFDENFMSMVTQFALRNLPMEKDVVLYATDLQSR